MLDTFSEMWSIFTLTTNFYSPYSTEFYLTEDFNPFLTTRRNAFQNKRHSCMFLTEVRMDPAIL